jgi:hypothetical protein
MDGNKLKAFVLMPFGTDEDVKYRRIFRPILERSGYNVTRADDISLPGTIIQDIINSIKKADLILCDLSGNNSNVFYELGYAHAIDPGKVIIIVNNINLLPFDVRHIRVIAYDFNKENGDVVFEESIGKMIAEIKNIKADPVTIDTCEILTRNEVNQKIGDIPYLLKNVKNKLCISGNDMLGIVHGHADDISKYLQTGKKLKILVVNPDSDVPDMLAKIDTRSDHAEYYKRTLATIKNLLAEWKKEYTDTFEYGFLSFLPAMGFFITDPQEETGIVKVKIYVAKPWVENRPHILIKDKKWKEYFIRQWENYWNLRDKG